MVPPDLPAVPYGSPGHVNRSQEMLIWSYRFICHPQCGYSLETSCFHLRDFDIVDTEIARWVQLVWKSLGSGIFNSPFRTSRVVLVQAAGVKKQTVIFENPFFLPCSPPAWRLLVEEDVCVSSCEMQPTHSKVCTLNFWDQVPGI